jgi:hypothetical protein
VNRSSLTEETPAIPGWVEKRVHEIFRPLGPEAMAVGDAYADCLAGVRGAVDVDAGHDRCRAAALGALEGHIADPDELDRTLQALEAEIGNAT